MPNNYLEEKSPEEEESTTEESKEAPNNRKQSMIAKTDTRSSYPCHSRLFLKKGSQCNSKVKVWDAKNHKA